MICSYQLAEVSTEEGRQKLIRKLWGTDRSEGCTALYRTVPYARMAVLLDVDRSGTATRGPLFTDLAKHANMKQMRNTGIARASLPGFLKV